ncbi:hypothetical protein [Cupriavidus pauculus]|uniref:Uncharacterized protein n=1 Tax=Cupriavidus pauculus TaxID=82633 RepID=A0A2N5CDZ1_9BURK|nr:hypothetical protein [Cupriavidus pauculus]PLQ00424.1 hypothetical protein CYJ10_12425 [Cupriavidus pauculus]
MRRVDQPAEHLLLSHPRALAYVVRHIDTGSVEGRHQQQAAFFRLDGTHAWQAFLQGFQRGGLLLDASAQVPQPGKPRVLPATLARATMVSLASSGWRSWISGVPALTVPAGVRVTISAGTGA